MSEKYILTVGDSIYNSGCDKYEDLFIKLKDIKAIKSAILLFDRDCVYFEREGGLAVMVSADKNSAGIAKLRAKKILQ
jgi:hypothetical protein